MKLSFLTVLLILTFQSQSFSQTIKNLVFEGAGIRGIAYTGAIKEMEKKNILSGIEKVGGTSAGAIIALGISLNYSADEITKIIYDTEFGKFNDGKYSIFGGIHRTTKHYGWFRGKAFEKWLENIIEEKTGNNNITFEELSNKGFKDLYVTGTCLNKQKLFVFSKQTYPKMKVKDAVRISMSIPLYFEAVYIDRMGTVIESTKNRNDLDLVVDGGLLANFPLFIFDSIDNNGNRIINNETLGFRIDSDKQITADKNNEGLAICNINNISDYIVSFYTITLESLNRNDLTADDWKRTVSISSCNISPRVKKLSKEQKELLIESGKNGMINKQIAILK
ncbi:MAG: patatin-like phospholipase family protein [Bacteroidota bacterium]